MGTFTKEMNWLNYYQPGEVKDYGCEQHVVFEFLSIVPYGVVLVSGMVVGSSTG